MAAASRIPLQPIRRTIQVGLLALWCVTPWLSWFRMDIQDQTVTYFGSTYPMQMPYILGLIIPFVITVWALAALSYLKGRVFCGWACPYGTCVELFDGLRTALWKGTHRKVAAWMRRSVWHRLALRVGALLTIVAGPFVLALSLAAYLWAPDKIVATLRLHWGQGGTVQTALWAWIGLVWLVSLLAGLVVRFHFCRYVCIYGMGQAMAASSADPKMILRPRFLPASTDACGGCQACLKACFVDLDPREKHLQLGFASGCFNCGDCIDMCHTVQSHRGNDALLSFKSGGKR
jgi:ferredoxin-type protein NapH